MESVGCCFENKKKTFTRFGSQGLSTGDEYFVQMKNFTSLYFLLIDAQSKTIQAKTTTACIQKQGQ